MNDFFSYLIPILFLVNSFFIGKLIQKKYISMNNALSFASGSIFLFSAISAIDIIFLFASNLINFFPYVILIFQIILVILYLFNWKKSIFSLLPNWNKLVTFIFVFFVLSISYFLFIYSNHIFICNLNIKNTFSILWDSFNNKLLFFANMSNNSINNLYNTWLPIFLLFISAACVYDFLNVTNEFDWKKYLVGFFVAFVFGFLIFNNRSIIKNGYSLVFTYSIVLLSFFTSKLDNNDISNYHFFLNCSIVFFNLLDSALLFYIVIIYLWFALFLYAKKIDFSLDMLARSSLYLLCSISFFFISYIVSDLIFSIVIFSIIFVIFLCLISLYFVSRKNNDNYFYKTFAWENKFHPSVRYINLLVFLLISVITLVLVLQKTISFNANNFTNIFQIAKNDKNTLNYVNAILIIFYIFYSIVLFYSVVNFFIKLKHQKVVSDTFLLTNITLILMNPLFICLLNSLPIQNKSFVNTNLLFIFYLFFVFTMFSKKILYLSISDFKKSKENTNNNFQIYQFKFLNLKIIKRPYLLNLFYICIYSFLTIFFVSTFLAFSYVQ